MLVAEALEDAAANDGPRWLHESVQKLMFLMAWPTAHLTTCMSSLGSRWITCRAA